MWIYSQQMQYFHLIILFQEMWLFNNATHQKESHSKLIYSNDNAANTSTRITKLNQISRVFHLH